MTDCIQDEIGRCGGRMGEVMARSPVFLVVGAGLSGAVLARELVSALDCTVKVVDQRDHVAGNCHTYRDAETGIMIHAYGPHIFNTSRSDVWSYVGRFAEMAPFTNRVKAHLDGGIFSMPINLHTINQFFGKKFDPEEAAEFVRSLADTTIVEPKNFEEQALSMMGRELYDAFFYGYTKKQWGCEPTELPASILKRLPMRFNYDDNYYQAKYQAIPVEGYTALVDALLDHPDISVACGVLHSRGDGASDYSHIFYTGPLDAYFNYEEGRLGYRTVMFKECRGVGDHIGNAVMNYPGMDHEYTRVHEHKHFAPWEQHEATIWFEEFSKETEGDDIPFYPKRLAADMAIFARYRERAIRETGVSFIGRLGTYRYINMDQAIGEALDFSRVVIDAIEADRPIPHALQGVGL